jgi:EAL domain-containing protein (putative c-di-GMP-specific phosphodiesterase class I)
VALASRVLAALQAPVAFAANEMASTASIGIAMYPGDGRDASSVLAASGAALREAQALGGSRFRFRTAERNERARQLFTLEAELRRAIETEALSLSYQPRIRAEDDTVAGAQAVLRWQMPSAELVALADSTGLSTALGEWVLREVCRQQRAWRDAGREALPVAIRLSPRQFRDPALCERVRAALEDFHLPGDTLTLEVAEATLSASGDAALPTLRQLRQIGVRVALADCGTGPLPLSRLRDLPLDQLKIAPELVRRLNGDAADAAVCRAIIELGRQLRMTVGADGVETATQAGQLRGMGCEQLQGSHVAHPLPADVYATLLDGVTAP